MGSSAGSIITAIIATHIGRKDASASSQLWPGIRIQGDMPHIAAYRAYSSWRRHQTPWLSLRPSGARSSH
jgi:hypothetical protein